MSEERDDRKRRALERIGEVMDDVSRDHADPTCPMGNVARRMGQLAREALAAEGGPAQVASPVYRRNWETIFGKRVEPGQA